MRMPVSEQDALRTQLIDAPEAQTDKETGTKRTGTSIRTLDERFCARCEHVKLLLYRLNRFGMHYIVLDCRRVPCASHCLDQVHRCDHLLS